MYSRIICFVFVCLLGSTGTAQTKTQSFACWSISLASEGKNDTVTTRVYGKLLDAWGHGIAWTRIDVGTYSVVTDEEGNFKLGEIVPGKYEVKPQGYCNGEVKKTKFKKGQILRLNIFIKPMEDHLPGLGIPGKK